MPEPMLAERCSEPELGPFDGVAPAIEPLSGITWGLQGGAMVGYRLRIDPLEQAPACVRVRHLVEVEGSSEETVYDLRLRCGETRLVQVILPIAPCEDREYDVALTVEVEGLPPIERQLTVLGGTPSSFSPCP